ncbi:MAG: PLP-dependent aminotransferase family protein [Planctomycetota bacterium]
MEWNPRSPRGDRPAYLELAEAIADDVRRGSLPPGTRLPTQRALARRLGVTPGTVARGYLEAERRGLIEGQVGRGTFVREGRSSTAGPLRVEPPTTDADLSINHPPTGPGSEVAEHLASGLATIASSEGLADLLHLQPARGAESHRARAAEWIGRRLPDTAADDLLICSGGQHALAVALDTLCRPGDAVACERYTYGGLIQLARARGIELVAIDQDDYGMQPDALERALSNRRVRAVYCNPTLQNPTTAVMPPARRREIAAIVERHDLALIEDDVYGILHGTLESGSPAPICSSIPERSMYLSNAGKSLAPGLRVGFLRAPRDRMEEVARHVQDNCWSVAPLMVELITRWIADGTADRIVARRRVESSERLELARRFLGPWSFAAHPHGFHLWLALPDPWNAADFVTAAASEGVRLTPTEAFVADGSAPPQRIRLSLGREGSTESLAAALERVAALLERS